MSVFGSSPSVHLQTPPPAADGSVKPAKGFNKRGVCDKKSLSGSQRNLTKLFSRLTRSASAVSSSPRFSRRPKTVIRCIGVKRIDDNEPVVGRTVGDCQDPAKQVRSSKSEVDRRGTSYDSLDWSYGTGYSISNREQDVSDSRSGIQVNNGISTRYSQDHSLGNAKRSSSVGDSIDNTITDTNTRRKGKALQHRPLAASLDQLLAKEPKDAMSYSDKKDTRRRRRVSAPASMFFQGSGVGLKEAVRSNSDNRRYEKSGSFKSVLKRRPSSSPDLRKSHHVRFKLNSEGNSPDISATEQLEYYQTGNVGPRESGDVFYAADEFQCDLAKEKGSSSAKSRWMALKRRLTKREKRTSRDLDLVSVTDALKHIELSEGQPDDTPLVCKDGTEIQKAPDPNEDFNNNNKHNQKNNGLIRRNSSYKKSIQLKGQSDIGTTKKMQTRLEWPKSADDGATNDAYAATAMPLLHIAAAEGNDELVSILIEVGVDLNEIDCHGWPALHYAICSGHYQCALRLIEGGVDLHGYTDQIMKEYVNTVRSVVMAT